MISLLGRLARTAPDSLTVLVCGLACRVMRVSSRQVGIALVYHGIGERPGDPASEILPPVGRQAFAEQLRHLRRHYRVVAPSAFPGALASRRRGKRFPVAITFDDDLPSHSRLAMQLLATESLPAAFFLNGASLHSPHTFWWEKLQRLVDLTESDPTRWPAALGLAAVAPADAAETRLRAMARVVEHMDPSAQQRFIAQLVAQVPPDPQDAGTRADDVVALATAGFEIGFHTREHYQLIGLGDAELQRAMTEGRDELAKLAGCELTMIAYPHGAADARVAAAAAEAGYCLGFTTQRAASSPHDDPLLIGRVEAPTDSAAVFAGRMLGTLLYFVFTERNNAASVPATSHRRAGMLPSMSTAQDIARRVYKPITRRIDGALWRLDMLERHRAEDQQRIERSQAAAHRHVLEELRSGREATRAELDGARAELAAALTDLRSRLDSIERRVEASHEAQVESTTYLARVARDALGGHARSAGSGG